MCHGWVSAVFDLAQEQTLVAQLRDRDTSAETDLHVVMLAVRPAVVVAVVVEMFSLLAKAKRHGEVSRGQKTLSGGGEPGSR